MMDVGINDWFGMWGELGWFVDIGFGCIVGWFCGVGVLLDVVYLFWGFFRGGCWFFWYGMLGWGFVWYREMICGGILCMLILLNLRGGFCFWCVSIVSGEGDWWSKGDVNRLWGGVII